jgi:hypothetical protein
MSLVLNMGPDIPLSIYGKVMRILDTDVNDAGTVHAVPVP